MILLQNFRSRLVWFFVIITICSKYANGFQIRSANPYNHKMDLKQSTSESETDSISFSRRHVLATPKVVLPSIFLANLEPLVRASSSQAFEGGVGGLGKTKPSTGVVFRDTDASQSAFSTNESDFRNELVAPDGSPVLVSFEAPWPLLRSSSSIESRAISTPDSAFVLVAPFTSKNTNTKGEETFFTKTFFLENIFGSSGKFGEFKQKCFSFGLIHFLYMTIS